MRLGVRLGVVTASSFCLSRRERSLCEGSRKADSCTSHVCSSKMDMLNKSMAAAKQQTLPKSPHITPHSIDNKVIAMPTGCPVDKDELGRSTWALLHTLAAYYPDNPSEEEKQSAMSLIMGLSQLYPCSICVEDFKESVKASPPDVTSRTSFSLWVCRLHNEVNEKLGSPVFECDIRKLDERWKSGREECESK